jgi:hypothetical protein
MNPLKLLSVNDNNYEHSVKEASQRWHLFSSNHKAHSNLKAKMLQSSVSLLKAYHKIYQENGFCPNAIFVFHMKQSLSNVPNLSDLKSSGKINTFTLRY